LVVLNSGTILIFYDRIYRSADGGHTISPVSNTGDSFIPEGFPASQAIAVGPRDTVYYGEYTTTPRPHVVRIVRGTDDGRTWDIVYTFREGEIFHVHSLTYDKFRDRYWIAAGDKGQEARLMYTEDGFRTIHTEGCCLPKWRLVDLIVTKDALFWGSDSDSRSTRPGIFRYDLKQKDIERVATLDNPSYYAARLSNGTLAVTTTFEPRTGYSVARHAPATTSLWLSRDGRTWARDFSLPADSSSLKDGKRPQIQLPSGDPLPVLFATPWHTSEFNFTTLLLSQPGFSP